MNIFLKSYNIAIKISNPPPDRIYTYNENFNFSLKAFFLKVLISFFSRPGEMNY